MVKRPHRSQSAAQARLARAEGAVVVSPALQRGVGWANQSSIRSPVGTAREDRIHPFGARAKGMEKHKPGHSRKCQTPAVTPATPEFSSYSTIKGL